MMERDDEHFDIDDEFVAENEEEQDFDRFIDRDKRSRATAAAAVKKGKAAWSKLEDVLAERRLKKELEDFEDDL
ncbi:MAG: hypothetical protein ABL964_08740 [Steroidobacteraceae bacterium]